MATIYTFHPREKNVNSHVSNTILLSKYHCAAAFIVDV